ncbi:PaaX family transcriptional regulator C-terminal domain-containing protein [Mycobacterium sp. 1274756.6]|uniref:PaaX family transcriptional regulator C-terminal domain-containing protein n=1 Tax=Mycobacterium sp. 1274756.6 TaxID=1834076 RepID=UPI000800583F|nr:PaaX family transcriptional regulator C-terminal domain-containing protein [Mycobacterium sp. 1274756.6]OBJ70933.1 PaaX domain-containing protein, C- domain protein [Mycobacterium sp. 1274756.6]
MPSPHPRLTARSVVLSMLLGAHPAWASSAELVRLAAEFGIKETTLRVALTRMVSAGDLIRSADGYRLATRLLARQRRQDEALDPRGRAWSGQWTTLVITSVGNGARTRAALRTALQHGRFGELREGVWLRPDNLQTTLDDATLRQLRVLTARDDDPAELAGRLWDLPGWAQQGEEILASMTHAPDLPARFTAAAAAVRHLLADPVLPDELLPAHWPGSRLRAAYREFAAEFGGRRALPLEA